MKHALALLICFIACTVSPEISREGTTTLALSGADAGPPALDVTGATCTEEALQALIQPARESPDIFGHTRVAVYMPPGAKLRICATLHIHDPVLIRSEGARIFSEPSTGLVDLMHVHSTARDSMLEDVELRYIVASPSLFDHDKTALRIEANHFTLRNAVINGSGTGVEIDARAFGSNMNQTHFDNVVIRSCRRAGVRIRGVDASGGYFAGLRVISCENHYQAINGAGPAVALEESSGNGNLYLAPHLEVTDVALRVAPTGGLAPSTFVGGYIEEGDPVEWIGNHSGNTTTVGGHLALLDAVKGDRVGGQRSRLTFRERSSSGEYYSLSVPAASWHAALRFMRASQGAADTWLLKPQSAPSGASQWGFEHYFNQTKPVVSFRAPHTWGTVEPILGGQSLCSAVATCP